MCDKVMGLNCVPLLGSSGVYSPFNLYSSLVHYLELNIVSGMLKSYHFVLGFSSTLDVPFWYKLAFSIHSQMRIENVMLQDEAGLSSRASFPPD